jgi:hypothetical protein
MGFGMSEVVFDFAKVRNDVAVVAKQVAGKADFAKIWQEACAAFAEAYESAGVKKYLVGDAVGLSDQIDYSKKVYVMDGLCGFAWVNVGDGRSSFARWLKENNYANKDYYGGYQIWSSRFGSDSSQSVERKEAGCRAAAEVFNKYGLKAYVASRLD